MKFRVQTSVVDLSYSGLAIHENNFVLIENNYKGVNNCCEWFGNTKPEVDYCEKICDEKIGCNLHQNENWHFNWNKWKLIWR